MSIDSHVKIVVFILTIFFLYKSLYLYQQQQQKLRFFM